MSLELISKKQKIPSNKPSIVFIHGACMGAWVWQGNFFDYFHEAGHDVYALSLSHHSKSRGVGKLRWTSIATYIKDLAAVVDSIEGPVFLIGHSMGGFTIQHYLKDPAKNIVGAALLCSAPSHGLWNLMGKLMMHYPLYFIQSVIELSWLPVMKNTKRLQRVMFRADFPSQRMIEILNSLQDESFLAFLEMVFLKLPSIKQMPVPVMIIGAEKDYLISVNDTKRMSKHYGLEAKIINGASHCLMLETGWEEVADSIKKFVGPY
jgi:pimeloyl-ACP methyl ester carboxylesterase